jgi:hypothetical protein
MTTSSTFKPEWIEKSKIDYHAPFMLLWVSFNSWYKSSYPQNNDRSSINFLKLDISSANAMYKQFCKLISEGAIKENLVFKSNLEGLFYALNTANIPYSEKDKNGQDILITFNKMLKEYTKRKNAVNYVNIIITPTKEELEKQYEAGESKPFIRLDEKYIINDNETIFAGLIEVIYQIRCYLFHGGLEANDEAHHEVVRYCYEILLALMSNCAAT